MRSPLDRWYIWRYFATHREYRLQLGCGWGVLPGWLNTDLRPVLPGVVRLDASRRLPFQDGTFARVFAEHLIEHFDYRTGHRVLRECFRVLVPGGRIRLATPDLPAWLALYAGTEDPEGIRLAAHVRRTLWPDVESSPAFVLNAVFWEYGHRFVYDEAALRDALLSAGFVNPRRFRRGESDDPTFRGVEGHLHGVEHGEAMNRYATLILEGERPRT